PSSATEYSPTGSLGSRNSPCAPVCARCSRPVSASRATTSAPEIGAPDPVNACPAIAPSSADCACTPTQLHVTSTNIRQYRTASKEAHTTQPRRTLPPPCALRCCLREREITSTYLREELSLRSAQLPPAQSTARRPRRARAAADYRLLPCFGRNIFGG